jgi:predicted flap endonuclease-1-like 5' DNA nuclease
LEQQLSFADEQRNKLDGLTRAQYAEISGLKTQLDMQKKSYQKLYEEAAIASETHNAEITNLQDTLASKREKIKYLTDEGEYLRNKILKLQTAAEEETIQRVVSEVNKPPSANLPKMVVKMPQNGFHTEGSPLQMLDPRSIKFDTVEAESIVETIDKLPVQPSAMEEIVENKTSEPVIEDKVVELEAIVENKTIEPKPTIQEKTIEVETTSMTDATNLQAIQGIDAETERVLKSAGIDNWQEISETTPERLQEILAEGKIRNVDASHWSVQAILLADGHLNRLKTFLDNLKK